MAKGREPVVLRAVLRGTMLLGIAAAAWGRDPQAEPPVQDQVPRFEKEVTKLRGLGFSKPVKVDVITKDQFRAVLLKDLDRDLPPEKARRFARGLAKFGVIPKDLDLREALVRLMVESTAAFYDPETKELKVLSPRTGETPAELGALKKAGIDLEGAVLVHELTHAAQDQAYDLSTLPLDSGDDDDLSLALRSVAEGDASAFGWKYAFKDRFDAIIGLLDQGYKTGEVPGEAGTLPAYLRFTLTFPYGYGTDFVLACARKKGGTLEAASELWKDMPLSSEQILHPEKYLGERDNPIAVTLPDLSALLGPEWKETYRNVYGEYSIWLILKEFEGPKLSPSAARRASQGWGGDLYAVLEGSGGRTAYVWYTTWDSEQDASEFYEAYTLALQKKYARPQDGPAASGATRFTSDEGLVLCERRGRDVLVFDGVGEDVLDKAEAIWNGTRKKERTSFDRLPRKAEPPLPGKPNEKSEGRQYSVTK